VESAVDLGDVEDDGAREVQLPTVGLDVDRGAIKAMQVSHSGGSYMLQHVGYRRLPPGAIAEGEVEDHDLLAYELKEFWASHFFKGKAVYLGVANQKVVVRLLDFPRMSPEDLKGAISFETQDHIPMPIEEAILDYMVLGPRGEGSDLDRILIVAAQREIVSRYSSAVHAAGLRPQGVDVKALSLVRSTLPNSLFNDEGAILLLDVGAEITNLVVTQGGSPTLTRFISGDAGYLAQAIAGAAGLTEEEAER
jgi:type IV pilus assembly protein PilM